MFWLPPSTSKEVSGCESSSEEPSASSSSSPPQVSIAHAETADPFGNTAAMRRVMDKLTSTTNCSKFGIELPVICVMGDTSSGKSSLLANLSMVELPCASTLTTRTPIQLQMKRHGTRQASISIQWKRSSSSEKKDTAEDFGERILTEEQWSEIPAAVLEAQEHILRRTGQSVASDIVLLQVQGPQCTTDLALIDLPGLVRSTASDESETLVSQVESLIAEHLHNSRAVILAVVPANVDFHNSQVLADARKVDPDTRRTIPVITKSDLIDKGAEHDVLELLLGNKVDFAMGFHMTKGRGQASLDRNDSIQLGLEEESRFFDSHEPWKSVPDRELFGTVNLRQKLGALQIQMIRQSLPSILQEMHAKRQAVASKLEDMGEPHNNVSERRRYYHSLCDNLVSQLKASLSGKGCATTTQTPSAAAELHDACSDFRKHLADSSLGTISSVSEGSPVLVLSAHGGEVRGEVAHLDETGFVCVDFVDEADGSSDVLFEFVGRQTQEVIEENVVWSDGSKVFIARKENLYDCFQKIPLTRIRSDPAWLKERIAANRTDDLACFLNVEIFKSIVRSFIEEEWKPHSLKLLHTVRDSLLSAVNQAIAEETSCDHYPSLRFLIERQCQEATKKLLSTAESQLKSYLEIEKHPYTQVHLFESISEARHRSLRRELDVALRLDQEGVFDTQAIKTLVDGVFERQQNKSAEDHLAEEMEIVLESYGSVATRRVIDKVPMVFWQVSRTLAPSIQDSLWNVTDDVLTQCMQRTPGFVEKYERLSEELEEMDKAIDIVESILQV